MDAARNESKRSAAAASDQRFSSIAAAAADPVSSPISAILAAATAPTKSPQLDGIILARARARARARERERERERDGPPIICVRVRDGGAPVAGPFVFATRLVLSRSLSRSSPEFLFFLPLLLLLLLASFPARISSSFRAGEEPRRRRGNVHGERGDN